MIFSESLIGMTYMGIIDIVNSGIEKINCPPRTRMNFYLISKNLELKKAKKEKIESLEKKIETTEKKEK
jgi:hypothetical protein